MLYKRLLLSISDIFQRNQNQQSTATLLISFFLLLPRQAFGKGKGLSADILSCVRPWAYNKPTIPIETEFSNKLYGPGSPTS